MALTHYCNGEFCEKITTLLGISALALGINTAVHADADTVLPLYLDRIRT